MMNKETFFRTAVVALLSASVFVACKDDNSNDNNGGNSLGIPEKVKVSDNAVDLGLTSGTKWAKMNIGATNPWDYGEYFAWGETAEKETYDFENYQHMMAGKTTFDGINKYQQNDGDGGIWYSNVKYVGDNKTTLDPEDDAAAVNWGGDWVMPSPEDFEELRAHCDYETTKDYKGTGVAGCVLIGNGKEIFFPYAGFIYINDFVSSERSAGPLWTNELSNRTTMAIQIWAVYRKLTIDDLKNDGYNRTCGLGVRAVCKAGGNTNGHEAVDFGLPSGKLWATMNVGAQKAEDYGYYLAWGETEPKEIYNDSTYKYIVKTDLGYSYNKYQVDDGSIKGFWYTKEYVGDNKTQLEDVDDAAVVNWGGKWKMPTEEQVKELENECYWLYTENYAETTNVAGYIIYKAKAQNEKGKRVTRSDLQYEEGPKPSEGYTLDDTHIFMPQAGFMEGGEKLMEGFDGYYWSSTLTYDTYAASMFRVNSPWGFYSNKRSDGMSIRPVCK